MKKKKKKKQELDFGILRRLYNIVSYNEGLQNLLIIVCSFGLIALITFLCWICR